MLHLSETIASKNMKRASIILKKSWRGLNSQ